MITMSSTILLTGETSERARGHATPLDLSQTLRETVAAEAAA